MAARDGSRSRNPGAGSSKSEPTSSIFNAQFQPRLSSEAHGTFSQLRKLIEGRHSTQLRLGDSVKNVHTLICLSLKVGLENEAKKDIIETDKERHILDCLDVIQMVIETACQALVEKLDPELLEQDIHVPLYAWLIIQLIDLNSKSRLRSVEEKIHSLLSSIVRCQHEVSHLCYSRYYFSAFLGALATDILASLETLDLPDLGESNIVVPGPGGSLVTDLDRLGLPRDLFRNKLRLGLFPQATFSLLQLLHSMMPKFMNSSQSFPTSAIQQDLAWILNLYQRLWRVILRWIRAFGASFHQTMVEIVVQFLTCIQRCTENSSAITRMISLDAKASSIWLQSLADIFSIQTFCQDSVIQLTLTQCLENVLEFVRRSPALPGGKENQTNVRDYLDFEPENRARKRIRLSRSQIDSCGTSLFQKLVNKACKLIGNETPMDLHGLSGSVLTIGKIPCAAVGLLSESYSDNDEEIETFHCRICDAGRADSDLVLPWHSPKFDEIRQTLWDLMPTLARTSTLRIASMLTIRRLLNHEPEYGRLSIKSSAFGEVCLHSLKSSSRELRLVSGNILPCFVRRCVDLELRRRNFVIIFECLKNLSEKKDVPYQETCIITLCRLAEVSGDEELNIILLRLLEYFGHTNPYVCAVAYTELAKLAQLLSTTPASLLRPFWRSLSITVVKNLQTRPHMAEQLCDLLGMGVDDLLRLTEVHILPYLVLTRKRDIIARIGASYQTAKSPFELCTEKNNLASILAFLLSQPSSDPEGMILSLFADVDPEFQNRSLAAFLRTEPILIARDLLKYLGDAGEDKESRIHRALHLLASYVPRKSAPGPATSKHPNVLGNFIEEHILGIITEFADAINDAQVRLPIMEKKRNILAIGEMIKIARGHINSALPQICACLRSALDIEELCDHAFGAWCILITSLDEEEVVPLIDQTFAIIIRYWQNFQDGGKQGAITLVDHILRNHSRLVRDIFNTMPSLSSIPGMAQFEKQIGELKGQMDVRNHFIAFSRRCQSENAAVVEQALKELVPFIRENEDFLHESALNEQPDSVVALLTRSLLDCCVKFKGSSDTITILSAQCLGLVGCPDPNRVESVREKKDILVLSNFSRKDEIFDFVLFFLQHVLVEAFLSASNTRAQGFLAYAMQALMKASKIDPSITIPSRNIELNERHCRWQALPETVRNILTPFLTSKYTVTVGAIKTNCSYPLFSPTMSHGEWLRRFVLDLLQKGTNENVRAIFAICSRIIRGQDISISSFLLPFAVLNVAVDGTEVQQREVRDEMTRVLSHPLPDNNTRMRENIIFCSESIFSVLDYLSRWLQGKKKQNATVTNHVSGSRVHKDTTLDTSSAQIKSVEQLLSSIPPEVISRRAVECKSFSRALFHWEQYIRQCKSRLDKQNHAELEPLYQRLQDIYTQIDEPDGIEGISAHLHVLNIDQQVLEHRKTGRWVAAQSWYELQLETDPENSDAQWNLLTCLKESGQQGSYPNGKHLSLVFMLTSTDALLNQFEVFRQTEAPLSKLLPLAVEASIMTGKWSKLSEYLQMCSQENTGDFNIGIGSALDALRHNNKAAFQEIINNLRHTTAKSLTANSVTSLQSCHGSLLQLHALAEVEAIANAGLEGYPSRSKVLDTLDRRLDVIGVYIPEKQYLLGLRRAAMELSNGFSESDIAAAWLMSARLSRKNDCTGQAYHYVLHAAQLKDKSATIEHARLLWKDGHHRKAIQTLKGAIAANAFVSHDYAPMETDSVSITSNREQHQNMLAATAHLLLAKWTDRAGQTQSDVIVQRYREAIKLHTRWEKAHYYLGKHYNKILESEKAKPLGKEAQIYLSGEASKLVIDNYLRSLAHGNKYVFQTLPKVLTLWLEHASVVDQPFDPKRGDNVEFQKHSMAQRKKSLDDMHSQLKKYLNRMPAALLFTILNQVVARICHANHTVYDLLTRIVVKTVSAFPQQGLWTVLALVKSSSKERASRGITCLQKITEATKKSKTEASAADMRSMINQGQKFSEELLRLCVARVEEKVSKISLARHLGFNHKVAPCRMVIPFQTMLTPSLPATHDSDYLKSFRAFPRDAVTIESELQKGGKKRNVQRRVELTLSAVLDDAQVLSSLQKPRKISIRGSDGKVYNLLCKPKDDLRKDQRLMEFNNMINRFLKKDVESTKRRLYIKTYAVTPLNEECGLIEWVDNLRTLREIVIRLLRERGIVPNYNEIKHYLNEACSDISKLPLFTTKVLARLGDRHGENILFEEGSGGILHVDFNCLFDKGLTFDKPELVPFRLTHNMIDAFGAYGYNELGPFRRTCEITLSLLRQNEDALMTILETFLYDPTTDFIGKKPGNIKRRTHVNVPETPEGVLECVRNKLRGLLPGESVPLSVDGHVDELIMQATDKKNLAAMYIGWCAFF
ncbi:Non-specific serine/threonine protein kinase [Rasamsonia emersonii CBS 393.64]|uniref:Serine/threonine-protein kinase MEC1 n=1 Tax=Rasamsonia emersonii (strain ATCC 16479 / CBS 393.64 / IMI 116815) TaxID=1408163 RepID=A0A0F4YVE1_RASE3|nr:Non-specific serine/threonine protein kinase [Rasamsonia emersonii CBS 393.64]KKA22075.1 Non-specific serine/threonine protein kinase [Rasamsonia emersonii CBS 393.64]